MNIIETLTKINFTDANNTGRIKYIVVHYFGGLASVQNLSKYWTTQYAGASAHYCVGHAGEVYRIVKDEDIAWHCGAQSYVHKECRNSNSIGIEMAVKKRNTATLSANDKDWYFTPETIKATVDLVKDLMKKYNIKPENVIRHYDVTGKICPNPYVFNIADQTWQNFKAMITESDPVKQPEDKNEEAIWNFFAEKGLPAKAIAAIMGNFFAECGLRSNNLQNPFEKKLGMTDEQYTAAVDDGSYKNFAHDGAGYGLAQWTWWSRKENLLKYAKSCGKSIGNREMQLEFAWQEMQGYKNMIEIMKKGSSMEECTIAMLTQYEKPADQSEAVKQKRISYAKTYFDKYASQKTEEVKKPEAAAAEEKTLSGYAKIIYKGSDGVNYRKVPDYNAAAVGVAKYGEVFTIIAENGDFYKIKSGYYLTKRADLVQYMSNLPQAAAKKSNEEIAKEVIGGKWGNGQDRKNKLTAAGYNYSEIQKIVNDMLK